jgi:predicted nucleic acid-binding protein
MDRHDHATVICAVTVFELHSGLATMPAGNRRDRLERMIEHLLHRFSGRVYPFDDLSARASARLQALARSQGRGAHSLPDNLADLQIAGIASAHGLYLATRNIRDFEPFGIDLVNPWEVE